MKQLFLFFILLFFGPYIAYAQDDEQALISSYHQLARHDMRLATIGHKLSMDNAPLCPVKAHNMGWVLHDIAQYPSQETAQKAFTFHTAISVLDVVDGSAADKAGIQAGDGVIAVYWQGSEKRLSTAPIAQDSKRKSFDRMQAFNDDFAQVLQDISLQNIDKGQAIVTIKRDEQVLELPFKLNRHCASIYILDARDKVDAGANGNHVRITQGLSNFAPDNDELAAVVAHELSHNILQHARKLRDAKKGEGALASFGKNKRLRTIEEEADRLSIWLMANAGFDVDVAPIFHKRLGKRKGKAIFGSITHNKWKKRVGFVQEEIEHIRVQQSILENDGQILVPKFLKQP